MSRPYNQLTLKILSFLAQNNQTTFNSLHKILAPTMLYKEFYNSLFRMETAGLIEKRYEDGKIFAKINEDGKLLLGRKQPKKDGVWKLVIFDIPEKNKTVRGILRAKLKQLFFKKWQNSIWISPFELDSEIEEEFKKLGEKFFVRLIKTKDINITEDLEKMF